MSITPNVVRTPDDRFENLPGFDFTPHYVEGLPGYDGLRVHYLDEGPRDAEHTFLCLHGQPTWCYLYRKMIPVFAQAGRVIAPDLLGFGRSDKPTDDARYTFDFHRGMLLTFLEKMDLKNVTLVCQDWGGILGLTLPVDMPERFARLVVMNTGIPIGEPLGEGFAAWKAYNATQPDLDVGALMSRAVPGLSQAEAAAYDAPFLDATFKSGVRRFPELVMVADDMPGVEVSKAARAWWRDEWTGPTFMAVGVQDPVLGPPVMGQLREIINGCPEPLLIEEGGHFVQEHGEVIAKAALAHFANA